MDDKSKLKNLLQSRAITLVIAVHVLHPSSVSCGGFIV